MSRGLLHYYFGSKERLLVEVVRRDCDARIAALEAGIARAGPVAEIVSTLVASLEAFVEGEPGSQAVLYEMLRRRATRGDPRRTGRVYRRWRADLADALREKEREGVVTLDADADSVASILFALGDGLGLQLTSDPDWPSEDSLAVGMRAARRLLGERE